VSRRLAVALFDDENRFLAAAKACRGSAFDIVQAYSPFPVHGLDDVLGIRRSRLPWVTLAAGLTGLGLGTWFQFWASSSDWPINVAGKPWNSLPAFVPVIFEMTVLFAGVATFVFVLARSGLRPGKAPARAIEGVTDDRFALIVGRRETSGTWEELRELLARLGATGVREEES
jgi:hypothetical protein